MEEISTSFCFICLLHLANERGLKLEVDGKVEDIDEDEDPAARDSNKVGNLWDLKVRPATFNDYHLADESLK